jgi:hypothetical protein
MVNAFFDILPKVLDIRAQWDSKDGRHTALRANRDSLLETEMQQGT